MCVIIDHTASLSLLLLLAVQCSVLIAYDPHVLRTHRFGMHSMYSRITCVMRGTLMIRRSDREYDGWNGKSNEKPKYFASRRELCAALCVSVIGIMVMLMSIRLSDSAAEKRISLHCLPPRTTWIYTLALRFVWIRIVFSFIWSSDSMHVTNEEHKYDFSFRLTRIMFYLTSFFFSFMALAIPLVWKLKTEFCVQSHATNVRLAYSIWAVVAASFDFIRIRKTNNHILLVLKIIIHLWIRRPHARTMSEAIRRMVNMNNVLHSSFIDCCCSLIFRQR